METVTPQTGDAATQADDQTAIHTGVHQSALDKAYGLVAHSAAVTIEGLYRNVVGTQNQAFSFALWRLFPQFPLRASDTATAASLAAAAGEVAAPAETAPAGTMQDTTTAEAGMLASAPVMAMPVATAESPTIPIAGDSDLRNAGQFAYALRATTDAVSTVIDDAGKIMMRNCMSSLKIRLTTYCLAEMVHQPEKFDDYQKILESIKSLE